MPKTQSVEGGVVLRLLDRGWKLLQFHHQPHLGGEDQDHGAVPAPRGVPLPVRQHHQEHEANGQGGNRVST